jgi:hypothetical protein
MMKLAILKLFIAEYSVGGSQGGLQTPALRWSGRPHGPNDSSINEDHLWSPQCKNGHQKTSE